MHRRQLRGTGATEAPGRLDHAGAPVPQRGGALARVIVAPRGDQAVFLRGLGVDACLTDGQSHGGLDVEALQRVPAAADAGEGGAAVDGATRVVAPEPLFT